MCVRLTHDTLWTQFLESWVIEKWTEIDWQTDYWSLIDGSIKVSFSASKPVESRFILLTHTEKTRFDDHCLYLFAVEFFGTLFE
jgi:hypothetical protein